MFSTWSLPLFAVRCSVNIVVRLILTIIIVVLLLFFNHLWKHSMWVCQICYIRGHAHKHGMLLSCILLIRGFHHGVLRQFLSTLILYDSFALWATVILPRIWREPQMNQRCVSLLITLLIFIVEALRCLQYIRMLGWLNVLLMARWSLDHSLCFLVVFTSRRCCVNLLKSKLCIWNNIFFSICSLVLMFECPARSLGNSLWLRGDWRIYYHTLHCLVSVG